MNFSVEICIVSCVTEIYLVLIVIAKAVFMFEVMSCFYSLQLS